MISTEMLVSNEYVALECIEINAIPHYSILKNVSSTEKTAYCNVSKSEFQKLLNEIHSQYVSLSKKYQYWCDVSIELLFTTVPVENQNYSSDIHIYLLSRAIDREKDRAESIVSAVSGLIESTLRLNKFRYTSVIPNRILAELNEVETESATAIVRSGAFVDLQNPMMEECYSFNRIPETVSDMDRLTRMLTSKKDCAVSFQLIPSQYRKQETTHIAKMVQVLDILANGLMDPGVGNVSIVPAVECANDYKYYYDAKDMAHFLFNIVIYGSQRDTEDLSSVMINMLLSDSGQAAKFKAIEFDLSEVNICKNFYPYTWAINNILIEKTKKEIYEKNKNKDESSILCRLPYIITSAEASQFFFLPVGGDDNTAGLNVTESSISDITFAEGVINSCEIVLGTLGSGPSAPKIGCSLNDLTKHMLIVGSPGSGKTTLSISLLIQLWNKHRIPFLVIEPTKKEYRSLLSVIPELQVFTPGNDSVSPLVLNPFIPPKNVTVQSYKSTLMDAFSAALPTVQPLEELFRTALERCYAENGWLNTSTSENGGKVFAMSDYFKAFRNAFERTGYVGEARNVGAAGMTRLKNLIRFFDYYNTIPIEDILSKPTVIELSEINDLTAKTMMISVLLTICLEYIKANTAGDGTLKNILMLDEAHVLLDQSPGGVDGEAKPAENARKLVRGILAERRSAGLGFIIADQSPRAVSTDVVALTDIKAAFRLVESDDREIIGRSTSMTDRQTMHLSRFKTGEAFLFYHKLRNPEEMIALNYRAEKNIGTTIDDSAVIKSMKYWERHPEILRPYYFCAFCDDCSTTCNNERRALSQNIADNIFYKYFNSNDTDRNKLADLFKQISTVIQCELGNTPLTKPLFRCIKLQLLRSIKHYTKIDISDELIINSLKK